MPWDWRSIAPVNSTRLCKVSPRPTSRPGHTGTSIGSGWPWFTTRLGHPDEARQCLDKGIQWLERESPPGPERPTKLLPQDWLEAQLLRREAEEMLKIKRSP